MKRVLPIVVMAIAATSQATVIYDTITGTTTWTTTGGTPRALMADGFSVLAPDSGEQWSVTKIETTLYLSVAGSYNITADIKVWDDWDSAGYGATAPKPVFQNQLYAGSFAPGAFNPTGATVYAVSFDLTTPFVITDPTNLGFQVQWYNNGQIVTTTATALRDIDPGAIVAGTSSTNLFYRDSDSNGFLSTEDGRTITGWTNTNLLLRITADPVPEPVTTTAFLVGLAGLALRRRRR